MMALAGRVAAFFRNDGLPVAFTNEALTDSGDHKDYYITNPLKRYWDDSVVLTVETSTNGGTSWATVPASDYKIEHVGGHIKFKVARTPTHLFRVTGGKSYAIVQVGGGFGWNADATMDTVDVTTFESGGNKQFLAIIKDWSGGLDSYWINSDTFALFGTKIIAILYVANTANGGRTIRFEGKAVLSGISISSAVDSVVEQKIDLQGDGPLYYRDND